MLHTVSTDDFYCACFVKACGSTLLSVTKTGPTFTFVFQTHHDNILGEYASGAACSGLALTHAVAVLKKAMAAGTRP